MIGFAQVVLRRRFEAGEAMDDRDNAPYRMEKSLRSLVRLTHPQPPSEVPPPRCWREACQMSDVSVEILIYAYP